MREEGGGWVFFGFLVGRWTWCPCPQRLAAEMLPFLLFSRPFPQHLSWFCSHGRSYTCFLGEGDYSPLALSIHQKGEYNRKYNEFQHQFFSYSLSLFYSRWSEKKILDIYFCCGIHHKRLWKDVYLREKKQKTVSVHKFMGSETALIPQEQDIGVSTDLWKWKVNALFRQQRVRKQSRK